MEVDSLTARSAPGAVTYPRVEFLMDLAVAGGRAVAALCQRIVAAQRRSQVRRELYRLSDHSLRDIGLDRAQIDRLFH